MTIDAEAASRPASLCPALPADWAVPWATELDERETPPEAVSRESTIDDQRRGRGDDRGAGAGDAEVGVRVGREDEVAAGEGRAGHRDRGAGVGAAAAGAVARVQLEVAGPGVDRRAGGDGDVAGTELEVAVLVAGPAELAGHGDRPAAGVEDGPEERSAEREDGPAQQTADHEAAGLVVAGQHQVRAVAGDGDGPGSQVDERLDVVGADLGRTAGEAQVAVVRAVVGVGGARGDDHRVLAVAAVDVDRQGVGPAAEVDGDVVVAAAAADRQPGDAGQVEVDRVAVQRREGQDAGAVHVVQGAAQPLAVGDAQGGGAVGDDPARSVDRGLAGARTLRGLAGAAVAAGVSGRRRRGRCRRTRSSCCRCPSRRTWTRAGRWGLAGRRSRTGRRPRTGRTAAGPRRPAPPGRTAGRRRRRPSGSRPPTGTRPSGRCRSGRGRGCARSRGGPR